MNWLFVLLLFHHVASPVDCDLRFSFTGVFDNPDTPEFMSTVELEGFHLMYCDIRGAEPKQKWMEQMMKEHPEPTDWYMNECNATHRFFRDTAESMMQGINQTGGVHVFQRQSGCQKTIEPGHFESYDRYAIDGETVMVFDQSTQTWMAQEVAVDIANKWNSDKTGLAHVVDFLTHCPGWLMIYHKFGKEDLRIKLPSVSFLQKSPFSSVSCHATGFYPYKVKLHWRKAGTPSVIKARSGGLPNNDGTYQLSVNMKIASHDVLVYECVLQFFGVIDPFIVRLNKTLIKTNWGNFPSEHSLKFLVTQSFGVTSFPEFVGVMIADDVEVSYCDSYNMTAIPKKDWMKDLMEADVEVKEWFVSHCRSQQRHLRMSIEIIMEMFQHSNGVHTFQMMTSFERKGDSGDIISYFRYGYDGEDFIKFDVDTKTWVALHVNAYAVKNWWDGDDAAKIEIMTHFTHQCPNLLRKFSLYGNSSILRTELPSVYVLQKSPLSPITCHATGFYPDKAKLFWRKDGEEIHNDTAPTESLPNDDDTFQMSVDLNISLIQPEDWDKYDCVFQLLGVQHINVTKLDRTVIRTNRKPNSTGHNIGLYIGLYIFRGFGLLFLFAVGITGYYMWRSEKKGFQLAKRKWKVIKGRRGIDNWNI